jgi:hypothetical protein
MLWAAKQNVYVCQVRHALSPGLSGGAHSVSRLLTPWARPVASNDSRVSYSVGTVKRYIEIEQIVASGQREKTVKSVTRANLCPRSTNGDVLRRQGRCR